MARPDGSAGPGAQSRAQPAMLDDAEIIELDPAAPPRASNAPAELAYLRDRRDPTGSAGIWRAIEGL